MPTIFNLSDLESGDAKPIDINQQMLSLLILIAEAALRLDESDFVTYNDETQKYECAGCGTIAKHYNGKLLPKEHTDSCYVNQFLKAVQALRDNPPSTLQDGK